MGCGEAPDAARFGDQGANTLGNVIAAVGPELPNLSALGLDRIPGVPALADGPAGGRGDADAVLAPAAHGRMVERSPAKDTMTGHWELMGLQSDHVFPTYPDGFPPGLLEEFEGRVGRRTLGNRPASGTAIIEELGRRHLATGRPIVYTSGDSVFQLAAHEDVVPVEELYGMCRVARALLVGEHGVGRVIARPFTGDVDSGFRRLGDKRRDLALPPPGKTALDRLLDGGHTTLGIGKIHDIFAGRGLSAHRKTADDAEGMRETGRALRTRETDLVLTNLVDLDSLYGHRRDPEGYAAALREIDAGLPDLLGAADAGDLVILTADHGTDPTFRGSDHTRECVPLLAAGPGVPAVDLGTRSTFADLGATILDNFGLPYEGPGTSFLDDISGD